MVNRKKGEYTFKLGDDWIILKGTFSNIALFEENVSGIYEFADKISQGQVKMSGLVNVIYCFQKDRENGLSQDDIAELVISSDPVTTITAIAGFMGVLFGVDESATAEAMPNEDPDKKK